MIKELCFWCGNPFPCGTPHPEGSDELARVLMDLEATTQCPDVDNNLQRAKIIGTLLQAERAAAVNMCVAAVMLAHGRNVSNENWATRAINCIRAAEELE